MNAPRLLAAVLLLGCQAPEQGDGVPRLDRYELGGEFTLTDHSGHPFELTDLRGETVALFFGYTHCPDYCPLTLSKLVQVESLIDRPLHVLFVTVDPARDSPGQLRAYLSSFDLPVTGLTGDPEQVARVARQYGAGFQRHGEDGGGSYTVDHGTRTYLIDGEGVVRYLSASDESAERMAAAIGQMP